MPCLKLLRCGFVVILITLQFLFYPLAYIFWYVFLHPLKPLNSNLRARLLDYLYTGYYECLGSWNDLGGNKIYQCGDDISKIPENDLKLFIVNHQLLIDNSVLCRYLTANNYAVGRMMWLMDFIFHFFPFGKVCDLHGNLLVIQSSDVKILSWLCGENRVAQWRTDQESDLRRRIVRNVDANNFNAVGCFPEGGLLYKRLRSSNAFAKKKGLKATNFVTLPKVNGFKNIVNSLRLTKKFQDSNVWVVDLTLAYPSSDFGAKDLFFQLQRKHFKTVINCKIFSCRDIFNATDDPAAKNKNLSDWLMNRFYEKDNQLESFYDKGCFQSDEKAVSSLNVLNLFLFNIVILITLFVVIPTVFNCSSHFIKFLGHSMPIIF